MKFFSMEEKRDKVNSNILCRNGKILILILVFCLYIYQLKFSMHWKNCRKNAFGMEITNNLGQWPFLFLLIDIHTIFKEVQMIDLIFSYL